MRSLPNGMQHFCTAGFELKVKAYVGALLIKYCHPAAVKIEKLWNINACSRWLIMATVVLFCSVLQFLTSTSPFSSPHLFIFPNCSSSFCLSFCFVWFHQPFFSLSSNLSHFLLLISPPFCQTLFQVSECNWPSRQAPGLHNLFAVCKNMHNWLKQNPKNVCVITCSVRCSNLYVVLSNTKYNFYFHCAPKE